MRINLLPKDGGSLADATKLIEEQGVEVLGVGTHREPDHHKHGFFMRIRGLDTAAATAPLRKNGYTVL